MVNAAAVEVTANKTTQADTEPHQPTRRGRDRENVARKTAMGSCAISWQKQDQTAGFRLLRKSSVQKAKHWSKPCARAPRFMPFRNFVR
jgi:hypothetical protein